MIDKRKLSTIVRAALKEDIGKGDVTTQITIPGEIRALAVIVAKEKGVLAGGDVARKVFEVVDKHTAVVFHRTDGDKISVGTIVADIEGTAHSLLAAERVALNFLQRMSGIATLTAKYVRKVKGTRAKILDTRKTTPTLRIIEKHAVYVGGGYNHRMGLYDQILIKDNHISLGGGIRNVLRRIKDVNSGKIFVEIEVKRLHQLERVLKYQIDRIMLDNMSIEEIKEAVKIVNGRCELEVSGNVNLKTVRIIAKTGVDYISVGSLTHSYSSIDLNMKIRKIGEEL
ncbi:MAG: carboxylating nicotinate-nucleotide diphosphorylase [Candidatus Cloacimonadota bacterium]|nr:MAG: carboxylating nicotinate-nucleotide diphosphorylase [Candidatus Cloacimonadota bacterium]